MRKMVKTGVSIITIGLLVLIIYKIVIKINHKKEVAVFIKKMPKFEYKTYDGKIFNNHNLKKNTPTLFIYFNSECDFCNHEAKQIKDNIEKLRDVQIVFVSFEKSEPIIFFLKKYKLEHYDNITFITDSKVSFAPTFDVKSLPTIIIYNKNRTLVTKLKGQTKVTNILKKLEE
jgi:peroxiredoxin